MNVSVLHLVFEPATYRQRTEGRSFRLIFVLGFTDDFDELPRLLHFGELFAEDGCKSLREDIDCMAGIVPFRYKLLQPIRTELRLLENALGRSMIFDLS
jgi:hypothetical protein